jgi:hypothetical protein
VLRSLLVCGLVAGLCGGLLATAFARVAGEGPIGRAIAFEERQAAASGEPADAPVVSRAMQESVGLLTAAVVYGLALGGLFGLAFAVVYGRVARAGPARTSIWLAAAAFVVLFLVPFAKYPANPPSVGDPDTITQRTVVYVVMVLASLLTAVAAVRLRGQLVERWPASAATLAAGAGYAAVVVAAALLLPAVHEVPKGFPAETLIRFRAASVGMQLVLWATIGLVFAATSQRVMAGRPLLPRRRRSRA